MGNDETNLAVNVVVSVLVIVAIAALLGGSILAFLGEMVQGQKESTEDVRTKQMCNYRKTGMGMTTFHQTGEGMPLDKLALTLTDCFDEEAKRELAVAGGPVITAAECTSAEKTGLNIYLTGPSEAQYIYSGKSYSVYVEKIGEDAFPDACIRLEEVS